MTQAVFNLIVGTVVRSIIMLGAGWLVAHGMLPEGTMGEWVSAVLLVVLGLLWGLYQKYASHIQLLTALQMPAGASVVDVNAKIASGTGATLADGQ